MKVLVINSGSSSVKFDLIDVEESSGKGGQTLARGKVSGIGLQNDAQMEIEAPGRAKRNSTLQNTKHKDAVHQVLAALGEILPRSGDAHVDAVGHRVVHGGDRFVKPTLIDDEVLNTLEELSELAPLHNPPAVEGIRACKAALGRDVPMVAVFDTAFHAALPEHAFTYALPSDIAQRHHIRRYGFHGTAHEYMLNWYVETTGLPHDEATIITLQLGNGCSATAIRNGKSVDTSMGFTPLEGLVMGTRSGDLDPSVVTYLIERERISTDEAERLLNEKSGLLGVSGRSSDMRELLSAAADEGDKGARLAIEVFCYRVKKYIGAYLAALGGAQAILFGGGIGENAPTIRARICEGLEWCGLRLDSERNSAAIGKSGRISADDAAVAAYTVAVNEDILIALHTAECVRKHTRGKRGAE